MLWACFPSSLRSDHLPAVPAGKCPKSAVADFVEQACVIPIRHRHPLLFGGSWKIAPVSAGDGGAGGVSRNKQSPTGDCPANARAKRGPGIPLGTGISEKSDGGVHSRPRTRLSC